MARLSEPELAVLGEMFFYSIGSWMLTDAAARERVLKKLAAKGYARFEGDLVHLDLQRALDALEDVGFPEIVPADPPPLVTEHFWNPPPHVPDASPPHGAPASAA